MKARGETRIMQAEQRWRKQGETKRFPTTSTDELHEMHPTFFLPA